MSKSKPGHAKNINYRSKKETKRRKKEKENHKTFFF